MQVGWSSPSMEMIVSQGVDIITQFQNLKSIFVNEQF